MGCSATDSLYIERLHMEWLLRVASHAAGPPGGQAGAAVTPSAAELAARLSSMAMTKPAGHLPSLSTSMACALSLITPFNRACE